MNKEFDFQNIGKRLPYTMPPESLSEMEANVLATFKKAKRSKKSFGMLHWRPIAWLSVAASAALLLTIALSTPEPSDDLLTQIDLAYANLTENDQNFLIEICQDDIFLIQEQ